MTDSRDIVETAKGRIDKTLALYALGDDIWWSLSPMIIPTPHGPQSVYGLMMHIKSPMIGQTLSTFSVIENPLDLLSESEIDRHVSALCEGLRASRSELLANNNNMESA